MPRRLLNLAVCLLLAFAALLAFAGYENLPKYPRSIGAGGWLVLAERGVVHVERFAGGAFVSVPLSAPLGQVACACAFGALILGLVRMGQDRRRQARGFPVDPVTTQQPGSK